VSKTGSVELKTIIPDAKVKEKGKTKRIKSILNMVYYP